MEHLKKIKNKLVNCVYEELEHNWENVNIQQLGEVIDMIKDLEKSMYYEAIVEAMEKDGSDKHIKWVKDEEELDHNTIRRKDHSE
jgi:hypothetical protein